MKGRFFRMLTFAPNVSPCATSYSTKSTLCCISSSVTGNHRYKWVSIPINQSAQQRSTPTTGINGYPNDVRRLTTTCKKVNRNAGDTPKVKEDTTSRLLSYCVNQGVDKQIANRVIETTQRAVREWTINSTDFLTPPESVTLETAITTLADVVSLPWGGYEDADRRVIFVTHSEVVMEKEDLKQVANEQLVVLKIQGNFESEKVSHRDFMGAVLNAGISRQKIGDIIVQEGKGAHVIIHQDVSTFLQSTITSVRNVKVQVDIGSVSELEIPEKRIKEIQTVESSMRLDAVVSEGFKLSRSKLADMIKSGLVSLNYKEVKSPSKNVKTGDVVSVRGVGKLEIDECSTTSKGRFRIMMKRFL